MTRRSLLRLILFVGSPVARGVVPEHGDAGVRCPSLSPLLSLGGAPPPAAPVCLPCSACLCWCCRQRTLFLTLPHGLPGWSTLNRRNTGLIRRLPFIGGAWRSDHR